MRFLAAVTCCFTFLFEAVISQPLPRIFSSSDSVDTTESFPEFDVFDFTDFAPISITFPDTSDFTPASLESPLPTSSPVISDALAAPTAQPVFLDALTTETQSPTTTMTRTAATPPPPTQDVCEGIRGVRPNAEPISDEKWDCYERGVLALQQNGVWNRFIDIHGNHGEHQGALFLVWHRAMLWEFEKELNAVEPGCKIPTFDSAAAADNSGIFNPEQSQIFSENRAGQCDSRGPFSGIPSLTRQCRTIRVLGTAEINEAITGVGSTGRRTETHSGALATYESFNTWIEGTHAAVHVAVGGSMNSLRFSSRDPVFYMHHAYIDKVWHQWQKARGGSDFGGERDIGRGNLVNTSVALEPWGMTAADVLHRISNCIEYENEGGGSVSRIEMPSIVRQSQSPDVSRDPAKGNPTTYAASVVPVVEEKTKIFYQLQVAQDKIDNPKDYQNKVLEAKRKVEACVHALRSLQAYDEIFINSWQRLEGFRLLTLEGVDLADFELVLEAENSQTSEAIAAEGAAEKTAIERNESLAAVNPKKVNEEEPTAVLTRD